MNNPKGIAYAALSSSTFGLAPLFTVTLLRDGFSPFEVLTYRWGVASAALLLFGLATGRRLRIARRDFGVVFLLSLFRAGCSLSLVFAYANIATGVASTIHFLYPLAVALAMTLFSANAVRGGCSRPSPFRSPAPHCSRRATSVRTAATRRSASPRPFFR